MYLYAKDPCEAKYQLLVKKHEGVGLKHYNDCCKAFIEYSNDICIIYENIEKYSPEKERRLLTVFDNTNFDMLFDFAVILILICCFL